MKRSRRVAWSVPLLVFTLMACPAEEPRDASEVPAGPPLTDVTGPDLLEAVRASKARFVVVNVWATWCGPCREEFPYVQRISRSFADRGVELWFVSTDFDTEREVAIEFLKSQGADLPSYIKVGEDQAFIDALDPTWSGSIPFTAILDGDARVVHKWPGRVEAEDLRATLESLTSAQG